MKSPRLNQIQRMIEAQEFGEIRADYLPGSWAVEIRWGKPAEDLRGGIKVDGMGSYEYPHVALGEGKTFQLALARAFNNIE